MAPLTSERSTGRWLDEHTRSWVDAGLLSADQADAIREFEHAVEQPSPPARLSLAAEVAAYVGSVLALMGGGAAVAESWERLGLGIRLAVAVALAAMGLAAGNWLVHLGEAGAQRLGSFLWVIGAGGVAMASAVVVAELDPSDGGWIAVAAGVPVTLLGLGLWRNSDRPLQLLTAVIGLGITFGGIGAITDIPAWVGGIAALVTGVVLAELAIVDVVQPRVPAVLIGAVGAYFGAMMLNELDQHLGATVGLVVAVAMIAVALREHLTPLLAVGVVGTLIATQELLATTFTGPAASLVVTLLGLATLAVVIFRLRATP